MFELLSQETPSGCERYIDVPSQRVSEYVEKPSGADAGPHLRMAGSHPLR